MSEIVNEVTIINKLGLHARAAATLVRVTSRFDCNIKIGKGRFMVDAKSILGMMTLAAGPGTVLRIQCDGSDASAAMAAVKDCIAGRFGEDE
jgi:phosphocarrier protein HPr